MHRREIMPYTPAHAEIDTHSQKLRTMSGKARNVSPAATLTYPTFDEIHAAATSDPTLGVLWDRLFDDANP